MSASREIKMCSKSICLMKHPESGIDYKFISEFKFLL